MAAHPDSKESHRKTVSAMRSLFVARDDCYGMQLKQGYTKIEAPLTDHVLLDHLQGKITVASYQLSKEGLVKWLCFDLDPEKNPDARETAEKLLDAMFEEKAEHDEVKRPRVWPKAVLLEASRFPDPSYHIWIFFLLPVPAKVAQWLGYCIIELACLNPKKIEVFPKQTELTEGTPYGNFVKLPLGKHQAANRWSRFLAFDTFKPLPNNVLNQVVGISFSEADTAKIMGFEKKKHVQITFALSKHYKPLKSKQEERIARFLAKYWRRGFRNRLEMAFLGWAIKRGITYQSARRIIQRVVQLTCDEEGSARLRLVDYHYKNRLNMASRLLGISGLKEIIREAVA